MVSLDFCLTCFPASTTVAGRDPSGSGTTNQPPTIGHQIKFGRERRWNNLKKKTRAKKTWERPKLAVYGDVEKLTQYSGCGAQLDHSYPAGYNISNGFQCYS